MSSSSSRKAEGSSIPGFHFITLPLHTLAWVRSPRDTGPYHTALSPWYTLIGACQVAGDRHCKQVGRVEYPVWPGDEEQPQYGSNTPDEPLSPLGTVIRLPCSMAGGPCSALDLAAAMCELALLQPGPIPDYSQEGNRVNANCGIRQRTSISPLRLEERSVSPLLSPKWLETPVNLYLKRERVQWEGQLKL